MRALADRAPMPVEIEGRARRSACPARSRRPPTTSSRGADQRRQVRAARTGRARATSSAPTAARADRGARRRRGRRRSRPAAPACAASPTASRRSAGASAIDSPPGAGTTLRAEIPCEISGKPHGERRLAPLPCVICPAPSSSSMTPPPSGRRRRRCSRRAATRSSARPPTSPSGLAAARELQPDCVLLDVNLPDGDGGHAAAASFDGPTSCWSRPSIAAMDTVERCGARGFVPKNELASPRLVELLGRHDESSSARTRRCCARASCGCSATAGFEVVAEAGDAPDLLRKVAAHKPDVAIIDVQMPPDNTDDGLRAAIEIRARSPTSACSCSRSTSRSATRST